MSFAFLNPWMLAGLLGIGLPVLVHLLSRKKYDVVQWGAMQFLELGRNARRRIRLEEILLMLLRMGMLALLAFALARPWFSGSFAKHFADKPPSDFVFIIDGSYSTDWRGRANTPHQTSVRWVEKFLDQLAAGDTVAVLDARDEVGAPLAELTHDFERVRETLQDLPEPSGTSRLHEAVIRGLQILNSGSNLSRHVVVVMDGQALPWSDVDEHFWLQLKELREQASVPPDVWVVNTNRQQARPVNYGLDALELSRSLTVLDFPIRIRTRIRNAGAKTALNRRVFLEVDGQRLADQTLAVRVEPDGQASVEFEHRFRTVGSHLVSVVIEDDNLPGDDRSDAVVVISDALPVLLVDGSPNPDPARAETFFARNAISPAGNPTPWISARTIPAASLTANDLKEPQVVLLANVSRLTDAQVAALDEFVDAGGGLAVTLGDQTDHDWCNAKLFRDGDGWLPAQLGERKTAPQEEDDEPVTVLNESLELPWVRSFRAGASDGFLEARFTNWYDVRPAAAGASQDDPDADEVSSDATVPLTDEADADSEGRLSGAQRPAAVVAARYSIGDPYIVTRRFGRGDVALLTSTIDADWTTLPAKPDYVAFLHELLFQLAAGSDARNINVGTPIVVSLESGDAAETWQVIDPNDKQHDLASSGDELRPIARYDNTWLPGVYRVRKQKAAEANPADDDLFVVNFDRSESDLEPVTEDEWAELTADERLHGISEPAELFDAVTSDNSRVEMWQFLLLIFLAILVGEVVLTRKLVQGGHVYLDDDSE